jgi:hypothetical protein
MELATRLAEVEKEIELGAEQAKKGFEEVRDKALYREKYANFGDYCQRRWGMSVSQGYRIALRDEVRAEVSQICEKSVLPNEGQARALADVPKGERALTWQEVVATAPTKKNGTPKVTAKHVQKVVAKRKEPAPAEPATDTTPSVKDELGTILPTPDIRHAFELRKGFKLIYQSFVQAKKDLRTLMNGPAGAYLDEQEIDQRMTEARALVTYAMPHAVCPFCNGSKCKACKQTGWMPEKTFEQLKGAAGVKK